MDNVGTAAAAIQAGIGNVVAGSLFATAQSVAMGGAIPTVITAIGAGVGSLGGAAIWAGGGDADGADGAAAGAMSVSASAASMNTSAASDVGEDIGAAAASVAGMGTAALKKRRKRRKRVPPPPPSNCISCPVPLSPLCEIWRVNRVELKSEHWTQFAAFQNIDFLLGFNLSMTEQLVLRFKGKITRAFKHSNIQAIEASSTVQLAHPNLIMTRGIS